MDHLPVKEKDHSHFIASLTAKIAGFSNEMVQYLLRNMQSGPQKRQQKKGYGQQQEESSEKSSEKRQQEPKKKYYKVRSRLPIDTNSQRPKAPTSSFLIYYHENKHELAKKFGQTNVSKLTKLASQEWKNLNQELRLKYQKISEQSKDRYQKEMEVFKTKYADKIEQALKKRRAEYRINWMNKKKAQQAKDRGETEEEINSELEFSDSDQVTGDKLK